MLFLSQIVIAQVEIVRLYGKIVSSLPFRIMCGMVVLPFLAVFMFLSAVVSGATLMLGIPMVAICATIYGMFQHSQERTMSVTERYQPHRGPSAEWLLADHALSIESMIADTQWQMTKDLTVLQYETFTPFDGMTSLSIPESRFWTNCKPMEENVFVDDDLIETSVDLATLGKKELFTLAKSHGIKVSGKGRTLAVIRAELYKIMYGE